MRLGFGLILGFSLAFFQLQSLGAQVKQAKKQLQKKDFEAAILSLETALSNPKEALDAHWELVELYLRPDFEDRNQAKAYQYAQKSILYFEKLDNKQQLAWQKKGYSHLELDSRLNRLVVRVYNEAIQARRIGLLDTFLTVYEKRNNVQNHQAHDLRHRLAFEQAQKTHTWPAYEAMYQRYEAFLPEHSPVIDSLLQAEMFESYIREKGWYAFGGFAVKYKRNFYVADSVGAIKFIVIATSNNTFREYERFLQNFRGSPFIKIAKDSMVSLALGQTEDLGMLDYVIRVLPEHPRILEIWQHFKMLYIRERGEAEFKQNYPQAPKLDN